jgi:hypothetical protein
MKSKDDAVHTLDVLHRSFGVFHTMIPDGAKELVGNAFVRKAQQAGSIVHRLRLIPLITMVLVADFNSALSDKLKAPIAGISIPDNEVDDDDPFVPYEADDVEPFNMPEADTMSEEAYGKYINAQLMIPVASGIRRKATVKKRVCDDDGNYVGRANNDPVLDTALYEIEFEDG